MHHEGKVVRLLNADEALALFSVKYPTNRLARLAREVGTMPRPDLIRLLDDAISLRQVVEAASNQQLRDAFNLRLEQLAREGVVGDWGGAMLLRLKFGRVV